jgi:predicted nucleotidyltransferase
MSATALPIPIDAVADLCRKHGITRLDVFGSVLRDDFDPARSDIDLLVEFRPDHGLSFFDLADIEEDFSRVFGGRKVDLVFRDSVNRWIRRQVLSQARNIYAA